MFSDKRRLSQRSVIQMEKLKKKKTRLSFSRIILGLKIKINHFTAIYLFMVNFVYSCIREK